MCKSNHHRVQDWRNSGAAHSVNLHKGVLDGSNFADAHKPLYKKGAGFIRLQLKWLLAFPSNVAHLARIFVVTHLQIHLRIFFTIVFKIKYIWICFGANKDVSLALTQTLGYSSIYACTVDEKEPSILIKIFKGESNLCVNVFCSNKYE